MEKVEGNNKTATKKTPSIQTKKSVSPASSIFFKSKLSIVVIFVSFLFAVASLYLLFPYLRHFLPKRTFTREELKKYDGSNPDLPIYLAVKGNVYDVTEGRRHYGKEGSYNIFAGRDASRAFVTGCFDPEKCFDNDSLEGLTEKQLSEVDTWEEFYKNHKEYFLVGYMEKQKEDVKKASDTKKKADDQL